MGNADGTCSCGPAWCDGHEGGCASWGLCFVEEAGGTYCSPNSVYPCTWGQEYRGRGPKQLSYNYNYGQFSEEFCGDKSILLDNPSWVATNPTLAWASSIWFWEWQVRSASAQPSALLQALFQHLAGRSVGCRMDGGCESLLQCACQLCHLSANRVCLVRWRVGRGSV